MKVVAFLFSLLLIPATISAQDRVQRDQHQMHRLHRDPKSYIGALEDPKRDLYQKPQEVIMALGLKPGEVIADIGAGSGYFTFRLAHHVGDTGKVYAVDESSDMIRHINRRIRELKVTNVVSILADPDDPLLPEGQSNQVSLAHETNAETRRRDHHDRLSQERTSRRAADANENRPRGSDQADGGERISPYERPQLLTLSVFSRFCRKVDQHGFSIPRNSWPLHKPNRVNENSPVWGLTPLAPQRVESAPMILGPLANNKMQPSVLRK